MNKIKPMPLWMSLLCFGIPSAAGWIGIYLVMPALTKAGMPLFWNFWLCISLPMVGMFLASLVGLHLEGHPLTWEVIQLRFRLKPIQGKAWYWVLLLIASIGIYLFLRQTVSSWLVSLPWFTVPAYIPAILDPRLSQTSIPTEFLGLPLLGNWWVLLVILFILCINIFGEEFWWRGYILPRQELTHGQWTWLVHGLLWTAFHSFWKWDVLAILPGALLLSYVAFRLKNTSPGIVWHWIQNGMTLLATLLGVIGFSF